MGYPPQAMKESDLTVEPKEGTKKIKVIATKRRVELKKQKNKEKTKKLKIIKIRPAEQIKEQLEKSKWIFKSEVDRHKDNIRTILCNSNATPIGRYGGIGYGCCFCAKQFKTPMELKNHTVVVHKDDKMSFMKNVPLLSFIVKLDITNLICDLCLTSFDSLDGLVDHLESIHKKHFHKEIKDHILPFKFDEGRIIKCVVCSNDHNNFKVLLEHMNTHFKNYVCDVCGAGFVNNKILKTHAARHKTGVFECSYCPKIFNTLVKKRDHERAIHVTFSKRSKCGYCGEKFSDYTKKNNHEVKVHGAKPVVLKCQAYPLQAVTTSNLTVEPKEVTKILEVVDIKPRIELNTSDGLIKEQPEKPKRIKNEINYHKNNIRTILCNSNATPIGRYGGIGYGCCFCVQQFETPMKLKNHTVVVHNDDKMSFMENVPLLSFIVKLDITNLICALCLMSFDSLNGLVDHLESIHEKHFHKGIKDHILPFKFDEGRIIKCVVCSNDHNNFKVLLEHMNTHFKNYVCKVCGAGFVNRKILKNHAARHKTGVFECSYCAKIFNTYVKKRDHERVIHIKCSMRSKCGYCGEKFSDYTKKNNHEVKFHGAKPVVLKCQACEKTYNNQRSLSAHIKKYH
ncbi:unnamed protein product [Arctia plantaginis]|uniref:C2H2-type domain-containing protein n=1 Tax=Arctia plantaginis TaxID=874455 RepID=A0A8S1BI30_ARCPL|nr:unnamed protein product [Arctia plantaginis]